LVLLTLRKKFPTGNFLCHLAERHIRPLLARLEADDDRLALW
jgi:hypothetical protein